MRTTLKEILDHQRKIKLKIFLSITIFLIIQKKTAISEDCVYFFDSKVIKFGNFSSPNWPSKYPNNVNCIYHFQGHKFEAINITFYSFELERPFSKGCLTDYIDIFSVTIYDVKRLLGRYCGRLVPFNILSMHPKTEIIFKSNHVLNEVGFRGTFQFIDESTIGPPQSMSSTVKGCGGIVTGNGGVIVTPNYPSAFPKEIDCVWLIRVRQDQHIYLRVFELQLIGSIANCKDAHLAVYDGYESFDYDMKEPKKFCGDLKYYKTNDDKMDLSERNRLLIRFKSDVTSNQWEDQSSSKSVIGFKLVWTAITFKKPSDCTDLLCKNSEFCLNPKAGLSCPQTYFFCIDRSLLCDGIPNCSEQDSSDEDKCAISVINNFNVTILASIVAVFALCILCCCCRQRRKRARQKKCLTNVKERQNSSNSSRVNLNLSDGSMQLRQLDHSPTYGSRSDGLNFFNNTSAKQLQSSTTTTFKNELLDTRNCSIHGLKSIQVPPLILQPPPHYRPANV